MNCPICGAPDKRCGGPTTGSPVDDNLIVIREKQMPKRDDMTRVDRGDGILVNMSKEEADNFEKANADRSDRTQVYNYAIETQAVTPADSAAPDRVVSSRTLRTPPRRPNQSPNASNPDANAGTGEGSGDSE